MQTKLMIINISSQGKLAKIVSAKILSTKVKRIDRLSMQVWKILTKLQVIV